MARKIVIVLLTPKDQQSSVLLTSQDLATELARRGHLVTTVTPDDFLMVFHSYSGWLAVSTAAAHMVPTVIAFHGLEPLYHQALREEAEHRAD